MVKPTLSISQEKEQRQLMEAAGIEICLVRLSVTNLKPVETFLIDLQHKTISVEDKIIYEKSGLVPSSALIGLKAGSYIIVHEDPEHPSNLRSLKKFNPLLDTRRFAMSNHLYERTHDRQATYEEAVEALKVLP